MFVPELERYSPLINEGAFAPGECPTKGVSAPTKPPRGRLGQPASRRLFRSTRQINQLRGSGSAQILTPDVTTVREIEKAAKATARSPSTKRRVGFGQRSQKPVLRPDHRITEPTFTPSNALPSHDSSNRPLKAGCGTLKRLAPSASAAQLAQK